MVTISSHVLDSVAGDHARGIRVEGSSVANDGSQTTVLEAVTDNDGRLIASFEVEPSATMTQLELVFHTKDYFAQFEEHTATHSNNIMEVVVVRLQITDANGKHHIPVVLSPHSYTIWWSA